MDDGNDGSTSYAIFPIYVPILLLSALADALFGLVSIFIDFDTNRNHSSNLTDSIAIGVCFFAQHFIIEGLAWSLLQYGCGFAARRKSAFMGLVFGLITFACQFLSHYMATNIVGRTFSLLWVSGLTLFFLMVWLLPEKYLYRRPAVYFYAKFWSIFRILQTVALVLVYVSGQH